MDTRLAKDKILDKSELDALGCWLWSGSIKSFPYGRVKFEGKTWLAHRLSHLAFKGFLDDNLVVDHLCGVKHCVNPEHLEQVTQAENVLRAAALITHCPAGHEYTEDNTGYYGVKPGKKTKARYCKECNNLKYWKRKE